MRKLLSLLAIPVLVLSTMGAAEGCEGEGGKAKEASYAGDGVTRFGTAAEGGTGKLLFNRTYKAVYVDTTDRQNCRWSLYTVNSDGDSRVIKRGTYFTAKIRVEKPSRVKVYLRSSECGNWKPS